METYKITKGELTSLINQVFEQGCCSYLDLKDSACDQILQEFLSNKKAVEQNAENKFYTCDPPTSMAANYILNATRYRYNPDQNLNDHTIITSSTTSNQFSQSFNF